ncbi:DNA recombinase [Carnobacterium divergens]|uniref:recombinase family protein n=1 Tax=Carnobacterium divergens TaxID=2748 RepID=UPI000E766EB8|nr:recombinase family protein [Carnobacterium divergens]ANZ99329.1 DNA recombinase [Carnobacterium divergens]
MTNKVFGYVRVSSTDQNVDRQMTEIMNHGVDERDIFIDKQSGKTFERPAFDALKRTVRKGDLLYIKSIDRFGRNSKSVKKEWEELTQNIGIDIKVLDMPLLDTTQYKDTLGTFVSELVLQVLSFVAEREREEIHKRQSEGIVIALEKGVKFGRPTINLATLTDRQREILDKNYKSWKNKQITGVDFMNRLELKKNTFYKIIKEFELV